MCSLTPTIVVGILLFAIVRWRKQFEWEKKKYFLIFFFHATKIKFKKILFQKLQNIYAKDFTKYNRGNYYVFHKVINENFATNSTLSLSMLLLPRS